MNAKLIKYLIQILIGAGLITSGILQQMSMQTFEVRLFELLGFDWKMIPIWGRIWTGLELYTGLALILNINPKRTTTFLLALISAYALYDGIWDAFFNPNELYVIIWPFYEMSATLFLYSKLIVVLLLAAFVIYDIKTSKSTDLRWKWIKFLFPIGALCYTFIYNAFLPQDLTDLEAEFQTELTFMEINGSVKEGYEMVDPKGDQLLLFVSLSCSHCFYTTKKVATIKRKNPDLNVRLMLFSDKGVESFVNYARAENIPYSVIGGSEFIGVTEGKVPGILYVKDGEIQRQWNSKTFNYWALSFVQSLN